MKMKLDFLDALRSAVVKMQNHPTIEHDPEYHSGMLQLMWLFNQSAYDNEESVKQAAIKKRYFTIMNLITTYGWDAVRDSYLKWLNT